MRRRAAPHGLARRRDAGAVYQDSGNTECRLRFGDRIAHCFILGHVYANETAADPFGMRLAGFRIHVEQRYLGAGTGQHLGSRTAQAGRAAGNNNGQTFNIHEIRLLSVRPESYFDISCKRNAFFSEEKKILPYLLS
jgi:hypothetical protein